MRLFTLSMYLGIMFWAGCRHPAQITAVPASPFNQCEPAGMPFYMPKPLLVVSRNVRHIGEAKVGLTEPAPIPNAFDNQASYADIKANITSPGKGESLQSVNAGTISRPTGEPFDTAVPGLPQGWRGQMIPDGRVKDGQNLAPDSFYTFQIMFVPDLSQKYGLTINGNPGEVRAAMNLVNGWMYTGMGPFYLKDSSKAQNIMAVGVASLFAGRGASDVLDSVSGLAATAADMPKKERAPIESDLFVDRVARLAKVIQSQTLAPREMINYAEVFIYEPKLNPMGAMEWCLIAHHDFSRQYFSPDMNPAASEMLQSLINELRPVPAGQGNAVEPDTPAEPTDQPAPIDSSHGGPPIPEVVPSPKPCPTDQQPPMAILPPVESLDVRPTN